MSAADIGRDRENTWNARLVEALHARGLSSARFEPHYKAIVDGRATVRKPDIDFQEGGTHLISGKYGEANESKALTSAFEYQEHLRPTVDDLAEVFAVVFPAAKFEKFRLHVLPTASRAGEVPFACDSLDQLADRIAEVSKGRLDATQREPLSIEAPRLLLNGARILADALKGVPEEDLESIFGGHDFFVSVLGRKLKGKERRDALRMGGAYLFTNQLLFYVLLSRAAQESNDAGDRSAFPTIDLASGTNPVHLSRAYFEKVRDINYEPIYGFDVAQYLTGEGAKEATKNLLGAFHVLAPNLDNSDLVGQLFQTLIPRDIRKPLGANYTNPRAATLLARLAIADPSTHVLDPACGSGTLLVAAYHRKKSLNPAEDPNTLHTRFVETELTGMDAMAFSAHLAVVNLASQMPLTRTRHVRVATTDSTVRKPGDSIPSAQDALPHEFLQTTLVEGPRGKPTARRPRGVVKASKRTDSNLDLEQAGLVIMNPPFTYWGNMAKEYRENLKMRFVNERPIYRDIIVKKTSQQIFFYLLAERFLTRGGTVAAVSPLTTFTGRAFQEFTKWFCTNYTITYLIVGLGRCAFSEQTSLTECLVVAKRNPPPPNHCLRLVGTLLDPSRWTNDDIEEIANAAESGESIDGLASVMEVNQDELLPGARTLAGLYLSLLPEYEQSRLMLNRILKASTVSSIVKYFELRNIDVHRYVLGSEHLSGPNSYGTQALLVCRSEERALKKIDRFTVRDWNDHKVEVVNRQTGVAFRLHPSVARTAIRRFSLIRTIDASSITDLCIVKVDAEVRALMESIYGKRDTARFLTNINARGVRWKGGRWEARVTQGSSRLLLFYRIDLGSPSTTVLATYTREPSFMGGGGYFFERLDIDREAKFLALWLNSSSVLHRILGTMTITRGTYIQYEKFMIEQLPVPRFWEFREEEWSTVEELFEKAAHLEVPSLMEQLRSREGARVEIDDAMLGFLGVDARDRKEAGETLRRGCLAALSMLQATMVGEPAGVGEPEADDTESGSVDDVDDETS